MKAWEIWTLEGHPAIIVSNQKRIDRKAKVVVLKGQSLYSGDPGPNEMEAILDVADGMDRRSVFVCDLLYTVLKSELSHKRGEVGHHRKEDISRKMIQGLALAGL